MTFDELKSVIQQTVALENVSRDEKLLQICELLKENISYYNWVGFYFANHQTQTLHLGPYAGVPTDHTVITFRKRHLRAGRCFEPEFCRS